MINEEPKEQVYLIDPSLYPFVYTMDTEMEVRFMTTLCAFHVIRLATELIHQINTAILTGKNLPQCTLIGCTFNDT